MKQSIKISIMLSIVLILSVPGTTAQTPASFNYQAVIRDSEGNPLTEKNIAFRISVLEDSEEGEVVFTEIHSVASEAGGRIAFAIGEGDPQTGSIDHINWGGHNYYLKIEMDPDNGTDFTPMGTRQLVAVPYAMHAASVDMPLKNLEIMETAGSDPGSALFEVKREDGSTVFAVYNEGVRIFVEDGSGKGIKGGFAVGGYDSDSKGYTDEYLRVTPDSVRVYIKQQSSKAVKGGFAVGGYTNDKEPPPDFMHLSPENYFIGQNAGVSNTTGLNNTFFGTNAGFSNTAGEHNIFLGTNSGYGNTAGYNNIFIGNDAGHWNDSSFLNVCIGYGSGYSNRKGSENIFIGNEAGHSNYSGTGNTMIGGVTGWHNETGDDNTFMGLYSGNLNISGSGNTFLGTAAGHGNLTGDNNVAIGISAGHGSEEGSHNVFIGFEAGYHETGSHKLYIESSSAGEDHALIFGDFEADFLSLNGVVNIRDALQLRPRSDAPEEPVAGTMYFDSNDNTLKVWDGSEWQSCW